MRGNAQMRLFRLIYILISVITISMLPNSTEAFGISIFIFGFGMVYDYAQVVYGEYKFKEYHLGAIAGYIGFGISIILTLFGVLVLIGCFNLVTINSAKAVNTCIENNPINFTYFNFSLNFNVFAKILLIFPMLAGVEGFFSFKRVNQVKEIQTA